MALKDDAYRKARNREKYRAGQEQAIILHEAAARSLKAAGLSLIHISNRWLNIIRQYTEITELDESILFELVDRIEVGETKKVGGQRVCDLRVYYRYVGNVDAALAQEERRQPLEEAI